MSFNSIKTTLLIAGLSVSAFSSLTVSAKAVKTARNSISTVQTEPNSAPDREFSPTDATGTNTRFPNNLLLSQDDTEHCIKLYEMCDEQRPRPDCSTCLAFCRTQGFWDFDRCPIKA